MACLTSCVFSEATFVPLWEPASKHTCDESQLGGHVCPRQFPISVPQGGSVELEGPGVASYDEPPAPLSGDFLHDQWPGRPRVLSQYNTMILDLVFLHL